MTSRRTQLLRRGAAEFLVIVTGILTAFYVDEFRTARASAALEQEYVQRLDVDLEDAERTLALGHAYAERRAALGRQLIAHVSGERPMEPSALMAAAHEVGLVPIDRERRLGRRSTYDELLATGNLGTLRHAGVRDALARYFQEYARVGGRLEDWPDGWRTWVQQHLSPDVVRELDRVRNCPAETPGAECAPSIPVADQELFLRGLAAEADYARGELNRIVQYQDRQLADLTSFAGATRTFRAALADSGLLR